MAATKRDDQDTLETDDEALAQYIRLCAMRPEFATAWAILQLGETLSYAVKVLGQIRDTLETRE
jgi:hypothetical protein